MLFQKPSDYSREKVRTLVDETLVKFFGTLYDQRTKCLPRDLNTLLAHLAVYPILSSEDLLYLQCAYQDIETTGII